MFSNLLLTIAKKLKHCCSIKVPFWYEFCYNPRHIFNPCQGVMLSNSFAIDSRAKFSSAFTAWLVCLSAGLFFFYEFFQLNLFDVINQSLRDEFHIHAAQLSWMSSAYLWANILFLIPAGLILDRFSTRIVILTALSICVIGTLGFALSYSFAWAAFFRLLPGIGNAFSFVACVILVSRWFPSRRQALVIGSVVTMAFIGGMMAHTPLIYLNERFGWRDALLIDAVIGALIYLWIFLFVKDKPKDEFLLPEVKSKTSSPNFFKALANSQNWLSGLYTACLNLPIMVLCALWGVSYLQVAHQLPQHTASNVVSMIFMGSILGCPLVGWLSDALGRRKPLMILGAIATLLAITPLFMGITLSASLLGFLFFVLGVTTSTQVITYPLIAESNAGSNTGAATAIASVIIMSGAGVGQVLFGWLMHHHAGKLMQQYSLADFNFAMWMFPIAVLVSLLAILFTQETYCERCG